VGRRAADGAAGARHVRADLGGRQWNDYLWPLVITQTESMRTLTVGISSFSTGGDTEWGVVMAAAIFVIVSVAGRLCLRPALHLEGPHAGATKG
jgi:ABC-type glycerol-3-phosphate transport system permease component